ncbi:NB-ARC domain-containing protein [Fischerella sp. PCC 9605]|uniref:NB-ARC domain-containing protein n=1 Tax=Fischerella sp. PCC 9605 TaxID=1173024 RepID=UPI0004B9B079|nr:NB-ARC domain-containing protein [Fischerella sp. PCC 9605]
MGVSLRASTEGLEIIEQARRRKSWDRQSPAWADAARTSIATLKRFWQGKPIQQQSFIDICYAVGLDWEKIVDTTVQPYLSLSDTIADWGEAPDVSVFYGRNEELTTLWEWIVQDCCRVVLLQGIGGIGKTALAAKLAKQIQDQFEYVIWRSLRNAPAIEDFLKDLLLLFSPDQEIELTQDINQRVSQLIHYLQKHRCLVVLDNLETILKSGDRAGYYLQGYEFYGELLWRLGEDWHQSCIILTTCEKPQEIALSEGPKLPVRSLLLRGLQEEDARKIFIAKGFSGSEDRLAEVIHLYRGNPLALQLIANLIQELFNGNVSAYLEQNTLVLSEPFNDILNQQFERLSDLEKEIMYWLAIEHQPVTPARLRENILSPPSQSKLLLALASLKRRSLIEQNPEENEASFTLQPVIMKYVSNCLVDLVCQEFYEAYHNQNFENLHFLSNYKFIKSQIYNCNLSIKYFPILLVIKNRLSRLFINESDLVDRLNLLLSMLIDKSPLQVGYLKINLMNLLSENQV